MTSKLRRIRSRLVTQEHGAVQWFAHDQPIELRGCKVWIINLQQAAVAQAFELRSKRRYCSFGSAIKESLRQFREAADFANLPGDAVA
jgi:hypothetical protein